MPNQPANADHSEKKLRPGKSALKAIYPVLLPVAVDKRKLGGREKVAYLSAFAREALGLSARKAGITLGPLEKNDAGAPLPSNGYFWSLAHKSDYVTAVAADVAIGIDIEKARTVTPGLYRRIAGEEEWSLSREDCEHLFLRYWTAKEAVLKVAGTGIRELAYCRIDAVPDDERVHLDFKGEQFQVRQFYHDRHMIAIVDVGCPIKLAMFQSLLAFRLIVSTSTFALSGDAINSCLDPNKLRSSVTCLERRHKNDTCSQNIHNRWTQSPEVGTL